MNEQQPVNRRHFLCDASLYAATPALAAGAMVHATRSQAAEAPAGSSRKPYVFVTLGGPDDGGDFGPHTPGTKTSGIQEALDYAHANFRDVYIFGGPGGLHEGQGVSDNIYVLHETLRVRWSQDFRVDGGNYILAYQKSTGHAIHIDSQMNCRYKFGLVLSQSKDATLCLRPETPGPDDFVVITASVFDFSAVLSGHPEATAILIDSSNGPIINNRFFAEEFNAVGVGVHLTDAGGRGHSLANNHVHVMYGNQHHGRENCTGLLLGESGSQRILHNRIELSLHAPRGVYFDAKAKRYVTPEAFVPEQAIGADLFAQGNALTLSFYGKRSPGQDIVFEPEARDNTIFAFNLPNGVTNKATVATNRIVPNWPVGFGVLTPAVPPSGQPVVNSNPYTVQVLVLAGGAVSDWTITTAQSNQQSVPYSLSLVDDQQRPRRPIPPLEPATSQTISAGLTPGQAIILEPGEKLALTYSTPPAWRWKALL